MTAYDISNNLQWFETDDSNITWFAEGQAPATVNDGARALQGSLKRFWNRLNATQTSTGSANAYAITYTLGPVSYASGEIFAFVANFSNTGAATLNVNSLGAKPITHVDGSALNANDIVSGSTVMCCYTGASFQLIGG